MRLLLLFLLYLAAISTASANPAATVGAVRPPAWVESQGAWVPLPSGIRLKAGDRIRTGPGGRVLLLLAEGSEIRVGAEANFVFAKLQPPRKANGVFTGLMGVVRGAFRFSTTPRSRPFRRRLNLQIGAVNAGISGTDVWAKAAADRDIVCLIEGRIAVTQGEDPPVTLDRPLSFYVAPKDAPPKPVTSVGAEQLKKWVTQVALTAGTGVISDGPWTVALNAFRRKERANRSVTEFRAAGIPAEVILVGVKGEQWHRLIVPGFADRSEAEAFAQRVRALTGVVGAWAYGPRPQ